MASDKWRVAIVLLVSALVGIAQAERQPEPTPSYAAQMFAQLETGDWRNWIQKAEALDYLARYDVPNVAPAVQKILDDRHPNNAWLRGQAVIAMAAVIPQRASDLAMSHADDPHADVRVAVARVCADLSKDEALPILEKLMSDSSPAIRFTALAAYAKHSREQAWGRVLGETEKVPDDLVEPFVRALAWVGNEPALDHLRKRIAQGTQTDDILAGLKGVTTPALVGVYLDLLAASSDLALVAGVWSELKHFDREQVINACRASLGAGDPKMIQAISRLMASYLREPALGEALRTALNKSDDRKTRFLGLSALSCVEADRFVETFIEHLTHEAPELRSTAVNCLAQCKSGDLYETLENMLEDVDSRVRVAALTALRQVPEEQVPQDRILAYFTSSLLSADRATRVAAVVTLAPYITLDNVQPALELMRKMQSDNGVDGTEPLMRAVIRQASPEQAADLLQGHGYVSKWQVLGAFPTGFGAPDEDIDGFAFAYPPEQEIDLGKRYSFRYNSKTDTRFGKEVKVVEIGWSAARADNAKGILYMIKPGHSEHVMPRKNGVCYAYAELMIEEDIQAHLKMLLSTNAQERVWLNGEVVALASKVDHRQRTAHKTASIPLKAGTNHLLVKVVSDDSSGAWWAQKTSTRAFSLRLTDKDGKPVKWRHK